MAAALPLAHLLAEVEQLAAAAGERIMTLYESGCAVERKADASPVTAADRESEALILKRLGELTPEIPILSEEASAAGNAPKTGRRFWLVDPLDGTREFCARIGEFTVNIALIEEGAPVLGVVHLPVPGETYAAHGAGTATRRTKAGVAPIAARAPAGDGLVMLTSRFHSDEASLAAFLERYLARTGERIKDRTRAGSALKFCLLAAGEADIYPRMGPTMEWDTAAGHALVLAAGGSFETLEGAAFVYGKPGLRNSGFIVRGRRS